ncbi:nitroreductase family protein [Thermosipho ferrireducens]|uniref:Nitroreductase family protein n=1 Tax=Thermosipho ferrireducens TaxID=2571116 RepID=A0ABX7S6K0_9BACT|nr:nitroreductase family protein [Thermosipho ferrireducens]QTA37508.1 nitroreductase family protein [Thermosipho ferrireducens]
MDFLDVVRKRRSIRKFKNIPIPEKIIDKIVEIAMYAPSGRNSKPVDLIVITERDKIRKVKDFRKSAYGFLETAPLAIVVVANKNSTTWINDASIVAIYIQLAAVNFGLGSCWGHAHERFYNDESVENNIKELLNIPEEYRVLCVIGIGYPAEEKPEHSSEEIDFRKIHTEKW